MQDLFNPTFAEQYALAKQQGDKRFGSECRHEDVRNGYCANCLRKVITAREALVMRRAIKPRKSWK